MSGYNFIDKIQHFYQKYYNDIIKLNAEQKERLNQEMLNGKHWHLLKVTGLYEYYKFLRLEQNSLKPNLTEFKSNRVDMVRYFGNIAMEREYKKKETDPFYQTYTIEEQEENREQKIERGRQILQEKLQEKKLKEQMRSDFFQRKRNEYVNKLEILISQTNSKHYDDEARARLYKTLEFLEKQKIIDERKFDETMTAFFNTNLVPLLQKEKELLKKPTPVFGDPNYDGDYNEVLFETEFEGQIISRQYNIPVNQIWLFLDKQQKYYIPLSIEY